MDYYVGLDVSLRSVAVCVIDVDGKHVFERTVECEIEEIVSCLEDFSASELRVGFESGAMSQHLYHGLRAAGFYVVCMEAAPGKCCVVGDAQQDRQDGCAWHCASVACWLVQHGLH